MVFLRLSARGHGAVRADVGPHDHLASAMLLTEDHKSTEIQQTTGSLHYHLWCWIFLTKTAPFVALDLYPTFKKTTPCDESLQG